MLKKITSYALVSFVLLAACSSNTALRLSPYQNADKADYSILPDEQLTLLAQKRDPYAQLELGERLCCGQEKENDNRLGYALLCESAKQGIPEAQYRLGKIHQKGIAFGLSPYTLEPFLLPKDDAMAYMWFSVAAENGQEDAEDTKEDLHDELSFKELNRAIANRKVWQRTPCSDFGKQDLTLREKDE